MTDEPDDLFQGSDAEESTPDQSDLHINAGKKRGNEKNTADDDKAADAETANAEKHYKEIKLSQKNSKKQRTDTPAQEMIQILKESASLRKRQYEEKTIQTNQIAKIPSVLETMDETDMFFLSMSKMTKQLPKVEQARIKLALSSSVLSAEIKCNEQLFVSTSHQQGPIQQYPTPQQSYLRYPLTSTSDNFSQHSSTPQQSYVSTPLTSPSDNLSQHNPSPQQSYVSSPLTSPSENFSKASGFSNSVENYRRPTLLEMVSSPHTTQFGNII